jgi:hypothetical protein
MTFVAKTCTLASVVTITAIGFPQAAQAATTVSTAELKGSTVRITGSGATPNARIVVNGGWLSGRSDANGSFTIESGTFTVPSRCRVIVSDGRTSVATRLSGCGVSALTARR